MTRWTFFPLLCLIATFTWFFPGNMGDVDSVWQLGQARSLRFDDQHPVAMAVVWAGLTRVWDGPAPMLLLQLGLYWGAVWLILDSAVTGERKRFVPAVAFLLAAPHILWFIDEIVKDVQLVGAWGFATALLYHQRSRGRLLSWPVAATIGALIVYGGLVRNNAGIIAGPIVLYAMKGRPRLESIAKSLVVYGVVAISFVLMGKGLAWVVQAKKTVHVQVLLYFDLVGISRDSGVNLVPLPLSDEEYKRLLTEFDMASASLKLPPRYAEWGRLWEQHTDLEVALIWFRAVLAHPLSYLAHRARYLQRFLIRRDGDTWSLFFRTIFSRPITWILILALVGGWWWRAGLAGASSNFVEVHLILSVLYLLTYVPFGIGWGYRYVYPVVISVTFSTCVLLARPRGDESALDAAEAPALG